MMHRSTFACATAALLFALAACRSTGTSSGSGTGAGPSTQGSGVAKTETREIAAFDTIEVDGALSLDLVTGPLDKLSITADDNLLPLLSTKVTGSKLTVRPTAPMTSKTPIVVSVRAPAVKSVELAGTVHISATGLTGPSFTLTSTGTTDARLTGKVDALEIHAGGMGNVHATDLVTKQTHVDITGAGNAEVNATEKLVAEVSGTGSIQYRGSPSVEKKISGLGSVTPL